MTTAMSRPVRDLAAELVADTGEHPPTWKAEVGDVLVGVLLRYDRVTNPFHEGDTAVVAVIRSDDGPVVAVWLGTVLLSLFKSHRPQPGDRVGIKRRTDSPARAGKRPYSRWTLRVDDGGRALEAEDTADQVDGEVAER